MHPISGKVEMVVEIRNCLSYSEMFGYENHSWHLTGIITWIRKQATSKCSFELLWSQEGSDKLLNFLLFDFVLQAFKCCLLPDLGTQLPYEVMDGHFLQMLASTIILFQAKLLRHLPFAPPPPPPPSHTCTHSNLCCFWLLREKFTMSQQDLSVIVAWKVALKCIFFFFVL